MNIVNSGANAIIFYNNGSQVAYMNTSQFYYYGNIQASGTLTAGGSVSCSSLNSNGGRIDSGAIYSGSISCSSINTNNNSITSGSISCSSITTNGSNITTNGGYIFGGQISATTVYTTGSINAGTNLSAQSITSGKYFDVAIREVFYGGLYTNSFAVNNFTYGFYYYLPFNSSYRLLLQVGVSRSGVISFNTSYTLCPYVFAITSGNVNPATINSITTTGVDIDPAYGNGSKPNNIWWFAIGLV
jgi:hypothetical protein